MLQLDTLVLRSNVALVDGGGTLQLRPGPDPAPLRLVATMGDLGPLAALVGADTAGADSARVTLTVAGPPSERLVEAAGDAYGLAYAGSLANRVTLKAKATLDSATVRAVSGNLQVRDAAFGQLTLRELSAAGGTIRLSPSISSSISRTACGSSRGSAGPSRRHVTRSARSSST
jgi:hypothetical protein